MQWLDDLTGNFLLSKTEFVVARWTLLSVWIIGHNDFSLLRVLYYDSFHDSVVDSTGSSTKPVLYILPGCNVHV